MKYKDIFEFQEQNPATEDKKRAFREMNEDDFRKLILTCGTSQGKLHYTKLYSEAMSEKSFDAFMKNPYWKKIYDNAPSETLKKHYRIMFSNSPFILGDACDEEKSDRELSELEGKFTKEDVKYLYDNSYGAEKSHMKKWLESFDN